MPSPSALCPCLQPRLSGAVAVSVLAYGVALAPAIAWLASVAPSVALAADEETENGPEELELETSDGVAVSAWFYPPPEDEKPLATVILLHDIGGSHETVAPLAEALQAAGCGVVAPDLRGHGGSTTRTEGAGTLESKSLKKTDIEMMAATRGGQKRDQSAVRGDVEAVRNWIWRDGKERGLPTDRVFVVGAGLGAAVAATWTAADHAWPDIATGPQGRQVRGIVLVAPTWTTRGFTIQQALGSDALKRDVPLMLIVGKGDKDGGRLFDQIKRSRTNEWYANREAAGGKTERAPKLESSSDATLFLFQFDSTEPADDLAATAAADVVVGFLKMTGAAKR